MHLTKSYLVNTLSSGFVIKVPLSNIYNNLFKSFLIMTGISLFTFDRTINSVTPLDVVLTSFANLLIYSLTGSRADSLTPILLIISFDILFALFVSLNQSITKALNLVAKSDCIGP